MYSKQSQLLTEIDLARCRAQWSVAQELIKKYKKLKPDDSVLEITVCTEVELIQLLKTCFDTEKRGWDSIYQQDTPQHITFIPIIDPKKVQHLIKRLQLGDENNWQKQLSKIILARIYFESGDYQKAYHTLQHLALRAEDVQSGYGLVLLIQARAMKGMCLEKQGQDEAAVETYQAAWNTVESQTQERSIMLSFWIEECLYRGCLLRLKLNHPVMETMSMMRAYVQLVSSHWSPHWRMFKRWVIFKHYAEYLVKIYQQGLYNATLDKNSYENTAFQELSALMTLFRHLFTIIGPHMDDRSKSTYGISLSFIIMQSHDIVGWGELNHIRRVLQFLYQVKSVTFNNPTISRFIFFTLMRLGSLEEAKNALRAYLDLMGVPDFATDVILDDTPKTDTEASASSHNLKEKDHVTDTSRPLATSAKVMCILARLSPQEPLARVVQVLLAGIYLYGHEEQDGQSAAILADMGMDLLIASNATQHWDDMYRARGTAYSLLASQCDDPDDRAAHHQTAIESLQHGKDWKTYYVLGLQQAMMRDTQAAITSIHASIELNSDHVPSWHLLALLYSCRRTDKLSNAMITLEVGLTKSSAQYHELGAFGAIPMYSWSGELNANDVFDHALSYLSMRMSQLALSEAMEGPEGAIGQYEELFTIYAQLTQQLGLAGTLTIPTVSPEDLVSTISEEPARKSSIRRASLSSAANSFTGSSNASITSSKSNRRPRSSSVESVKAAGTSVVPRRAESDTDEYSDGSSYTAPSILSSRRRRLSRKSPSLAKTLKQQQYQQQQEAAAAAELKKKNLQLIDLGLARRIGTAVASQSIHQGSHRSLADTSYAAVSLASYFTPSYTKGTLRSNSVSSRTSSVVMQSKVVTKDGLMVSTFNQHHQAFELRKKTQWHSVLVTLWLMSTGTFIKAGLLDEASKALSEAEQLGLGDPNVWHRLGKFSLEVRQWLLQKQQPSMEEQKAIREMKQVATDAFEKALVLDPEHVASQVDKAKLLAETELVLAEGLLDRVTHGLGWDSPEAWLEYASIKKEQGQWGRAKDCLLYALELNDTEPIRSLSILPKFIL